MQLPAHGCAGKHPVGRHPFHVRVPPSAVSANRRVRLLAPDQRLPVGRHPPPVPRTERRSRNRSELFSAISLFPFAFGLIRGYINAIEKAPCDRRMDFPRNRCGPPPGAADGRHKHFTGMGSCTVKKSLATTTPMLSARQIPLLREFCRRQGSDTHVRSGSCRGGAL